MEPVTGDLGWIRSSACEANTCVEVAVTRDEVYVRDSKDADGEPLRVTSEAWDAFVRAVVAGEIAPD